jgi:hypothetical protein
MMERLLAKSDEKWEKRMDAMLTKYDERVDTKLKIHTQRVDKQIADLQQLLTSQIAEVKATAAASSAGSAFGGGGGGGGGGGAGTGSASGSFRGLDKELEWAEVKGLAEFPNGRPTDMSCLTDSETAEYLAALFLQIPSTIQQLVSQEKTNTKNNRGSLNSKIFVVLKTPSRDGCWKVRNAIADAMLANPSLRVKDKMSTSVGVQVMDHRKPYMAALGKCMRVLIQNFGLSKSAFKIEWNGTPGKVLLLQDRPHTLGLWTVDKGWELIAGVVEQLPGKPTTEAFMALVR